jgi:hypothetical protein
VTRGRRSPRAPAIATTVTRDGDTELALPVDADDRFGAWIVYRPSGEHNAEGLEVWSESIESEWPETAPADL